MLRNCIVAALRDQAHERLLRETALTLQKAIDVCRTNEMSASQAAPYETPL